MNKHGRIFSALILVFVLGCNSRPTNENRANAPYLTGIGFGCPARIVFLDRLLVDTEVHTGTELRVGEYYTPIITINDFPMETYPGTLMR